MPLFSRRKLLSQRLKIHIIFSFSLVSLAAFFPHPSQSLVLQPRTFWQDEGSRVLQLLERKEGSIIFYSAVDLFLLGIGYVTCFSGINGWVLMFWWVFLSIVCWSYWGVFLEWQNMFCWAQSYPTFQCWCSHTNRLWWWNPSLWWHPMVVMVVVSHGRHMNVEESLTSGFYCSYIDTRKMN